MAILSSLLPRIFDEMPAVPEVLALRALSDAVKEFCSRTHAWQARIPSINLRPGTKVYGLYPDEGLAIVAMKEVRLDGAPLRAVAPDTVARHALQQAGRPGAYIQISPSAFELVRPPVDAARLTVTAAMTLTLGATSVEIPDSLLDEYGEAIACGAKMRLVKMASQPWFAPDAALAYAPIFYAAVNTAKARSMLSLGAADAQIEMRSWA